MKTIGIIAEFNPFHNGHKYLIEKCKKELGGITGDTEGFFVVVYESAKAVAAAIINIVAGII